MAWDDEAEDEKISEFNPAALKMRRIDKAETLLNEINGNLLAFNPEYGVYNFELKFSTCDSLYLEVESKLNEDEKKEGESLRVALKQLMKKYKVYEERRDKVYPYKKIIKLNESHWKVIEKWLFRYEKLVRALLDKHGMDTKYIDDSGL